jgi:DNA-binding IclR family transcriptional regulator
MRLDFLIIEKPMQISAQNNQPKRKVIASVQRALDILNLFDSTHFEWGNAEIARQLGLNPSTVAGLVSTLKTNHYLNQNPANRKYRLGIKLVEKASLLLEQLDLRKVASPYLETLRDWCNESINLAIRDNEDVVYIERIFGNHSLGIRSELGKRAPVHSTALGKAMVAYLPDQEAKEYLERYTFFGVTRYTIVDLDRFQQELDRVRRQGFAIDEEENEIGGRCVAAPVFDHDGYPVAAISISVPIQRLPREKIPDFGEKVREAAREISFSIGYQLK